MVEFVIFFCRRGLVWIKDQNCKLSPYHIQVLVVCNTLRTCLDPIWNCTLWWKCCFRHSFHRVVLRFLRSFTMLSFYSSYQQERRKYYIYDLCLTLNKHKHIAVSFLWRLVIAIHQWNQNWSSLQRHISWLHVG